MNCSITGSTFKKCFLIFFALETSAVAGTEDLGRALVEQFGPQRVIDAKSLERVAPVIQLPESVLQSVFNSGEIKNQHQTQTSSASNSPQLRIFAERMMSNLPTINGQVKTLLPKSGIISVLKDPGMNYQLRYGKVLFQLRTEEYSRMSYTIGDSLERFADLGRGGPLSSSNRKILIGPFTDAPHFHNSASSSAPNSINAYDEFQVWGDLKLEHIVRIFVPSLTWRSRMTEIKEASDKFGFEIWTFEGNILPSTQLARGKTFFMKKIKLSYKPTLNLKSQKHYKLSATGKELISDLQALRQTVMMKHIYEPVRVEALKILLAYGVWDKMLAHQLPPSISKNTDANFENLILKLNLKSHLIRKRTLIPEWTYLDWVLSQYGHKLYNLGTSQNRALRLISLFQGRAIPDDLRERIEAQLVEAMLSQKQHDIPEDIESRFGNELLSLPKTSLGVSCRKTLAAE